MWPRRLDGWFRIDAVVDHLLALARDEIDRPRPVPHVGGGVPVAASGLHVMHAAAVVLEVLPTETSPQDLVARVSDERQRTRIQAHLVRGGLSDGDLRALADSTGMFFGRSMKTDDIDPFEPISPGILTVLRLGDDRGGEVTRRFVLLLDRRGDRLMIADPSGPGVVTIGRRTLVAAWRLGATGSGPYVGTLSVWAHDQRRIDRPNE